MNASEPILSTLDRDETLAQHPMVCPTCGAPQPPANQCRRCQSDLTLLRAAIDEHDRLRDRCLCELRQRRIGRATRTAERLCELWPSPENIRLLATCFLLQGRFSQALASQIRLTRPE
jgi:ribosomal protein L40E